MTRFWGKLHHHPDAATFQELALVDHCIDVAQVFRALCNLPGIRRQLAAALPAGDSADVCLDRLAVIALLHDMGKCNVGFQAKRDPQAHNTAGHVREVAPLFFDEALCAKTVESLGLRDLASWLSEPESLSRLLLAAVSHHGKPVFDWSVAESINLRSMVRHWQPTDVLDPFAGLNELGMAARRAFPLAFHAGPSPMTVSIDLEHHFAGLVMLADWLGSHREAFFPFAHEGDRIDWSRLQAKKALAAVGLDIAAARERLVGGLPDFATVFGIDGLPRPLQAALASADLPPLLIAESDTGSGKTEAALMHFLALFAAGYVDGLYFALPTRVAARELYGRVTAAMRQVFAEICPPVLLAVPGYAHIDGEPVHVLPAEVHLYHDDDQFRRERTWAAERPKRFLAAPIAVGTVDQALLSTIQVPHAHLRAACLDRSLLVIDEVHSSDVYMRYLSRRLLDRHLNAGGRALLLSATLGSAARAEYLAPGRRPPSPEPFDDAASKPYPALCAPGEAVRALSDPGGRAKTVRLEPLNSLQQPEDMFPRLREAMCSGLRVLVVLNTVSRAIALTRRADADPELAPFLFAVGSHRCPHHGRFARPDRELLDKEVSARLGKGSPAGALLLIGTQTLEQSLDIDADWLITDLCPVDVLLQRIGRLHRHNRGTRPAPVCTVLLPEEHDFSAFINRSGEVRRKGLAGLGTVYEDLRILKLTRDLVAEAPAIEIPRDNRRLVEAATHPDRVATLQSGAWARHAQYIEGVGGAQQSVAHAALIPHEHFGEFLFFIHDEGPLATRLGLNDRRLLLGGAFISPFGQPIDEINLPGHIAKGLDADLAQSVSQEPESLLIQADSPGKFFYRYSRFGLEKIDEPAG
jgi:CRISPR-associated endonuclease/helicase Cas3